MKRAFTIYYDDSKWNPNDEAMIYKIESSNYFEWENKLVKASILRDCFEHFLKVYNDGDPLSLDQLSEVEAEWGRYAK